MKIFLIFLYFYSFSFLLFFSFFFLVPSFIMLIKIYHFCFSSFFIRFFFFHWAIIIFENTFSTVVFAPQGRMLPHNISQGVIISNHSLVLQGVSRATAGNYSCVGFNAEGDGISPPFTLNVLCKFVFNSLLLVDLYIFEYNMRLYNF